MSSSSSPTSSGSSAGVKDARELDGPTRPGLNPPSEARKRSEDKRSKEVDVAHSRGILKIAALVVAAMAAQPAGAASAPQPAVAAAPLRLSNAAMQHIQELHGPESNAQASAKYAPGTTEQAIRALIAETLSKGKVSPNTGDRGGTRYDYTFAQPIGTSITGEPASRLRVFLDDSGEITTAFPR
jgi:hypothetical protein